MDASTLQTLLAVVDVVVRLGPQIPELILAVETLKNIIATGQPPSADQQAQIDSGLAAAHQALQASG